MEVGGRKIEDSFVSCVSTFGDEFADTVQGKCAGQLLACRLTQRFISPRPESRGQFLRGILQVDVENLMNHLLSAMDFNWILTGLSEELLQVGLLVCRKSSQAGAHALARVDALAVAI